ncbi:MAG: M48 family peptidase, partial [Gammaproteobacteria bacterium]
MNRGMWQMRLIIMLVIAGFSVFSFFSKTSVNPITGESQRVGLTQDQEIAMGLQAAPEMAAQFGGMYTDERVQQSVKALG